MKPNLELKGNHCEGVVELLNRVLADEFVPGTKTRKCRWHVTGLMEQHEKMAWMLRAILLG